MRLDRWVRVSIDSIIRALVAVTACCAVIGAPLVVLGLRETAVPFLLATAIGLGLIVVAVTWRLLTRAHPDPN
jgi:hypothetical protein